MAALSNPNSRRTQRKELGRDHTFCGPPPMTSEQVKGHTPGPGCFVESKCQVGGVLCPMWDEWFQACDDTDPDAIAEERDPKPLLEWPFNPLACERPDTCWHYRATISRTGAA